MELTFRNAILKILQHKFASPVSSFSHFIHIQGSWYLTFFSLGIFNFYLILLFSCFMCFSTSLLPQAPNPSQSKVREESMYLNKVQ